METFEPLIFYDIFDDFDNGHRLKVLYFRYVSAAMFLLRGSASTRCTGEGLAPNGLMLKMVVENKTKLF